jgi:hypothetical protein
MQSDHLVILMVVRAMRVFGKVRLPEAVHSWLS